MAFTLETGSGVVGANAYLSVAAFKTYCDDHGYDYSGYSDAQIEVAGVQASEYADKRYGRRYRGAKQSSSQGMEWPRTDAYDDDDFTLSGVPSALQKATAEYMWLVLQLERNLAPMSPPDFGIYDPATGTVTNDAGGKIIETAEEVGPVKEKVRYEGSNNSNRPMVGTGNLIQRIPEYPQADLWMEELIESYTDRSLYRG